MRQTAAWLVETTCVEEEFGLHLSEPFALKSLLRHHSQVHTLSTGETHSSLCSKSFELREESNETTSVSAAPSCCMEDVILSTLALPALLTAEKYSEIDSDDGDREEQMLALDEDEEDSSQSSDITADDWLPAKRSGEA